VGNACGKKAALPVEKRRWTGEKMNAKEAKSSRRSLQVGINEGIWNCSKEESQPDGD